MGLLDDAIREHLELKRRNGADPGEIAHQERAALEPVFPGEPAAADDDAAAEADAGSELEVPADVEAPASAQTPEHERVGASAVANGADAEPVAAPRASGAGDIAAVSQETAEIDMDELLAHDADGGAPAEDDLEWESPRDRDGEPLPQQLPGQERLTFE